MNRHHHDKSYNNRSRQFPRNSSRARSEASDVQPSVEGWYQQPSAAWEAHFPMGPPPPPSSQPPIQQFIFSGNASYNQSMMPSAHESSQSNPSPSPAPMFPSYSPVPSPAPTYPSYSPAPVAVGSMGRGPMPREQQNYQDAWSVMHTPVKQVVEPLEQCQNCGYKKPNHFCWECVFINKDGFMKDICHVCNSSDHRYANCKKRLAYEVGSRQRLDYDHYWTVIVRMGKCAVPSAPSFLETWDNSGRITNYVPNSPEFCQQLIHKGSPLGQPRHDYKNFPYTGSPYADQEYLPHDPVFARIRRSLGDINVRLPVTPMTQPRGRRTSDRSRQGRDRRSRSPKSDVVMPDVSRRERSPHRRDRRSCSPNSDVVMPDVSRRERSPHRRDSSQDSVRYEGTRRRPQPGDVQSVVSSAPTTSMGNAPSVISSTATTSLGEEQDAHSMVGSVSTSLLLRRPTSNSYVTHVRSARAPSARRASAVIRARRAAMRKKLPEGENWILPEDEDLVQPGGSAGHSTTGHSSTGLTEAIGKVTLAGLNQVAALRATAQARGDPCNNCGNASEVHHAKPDECPMPCGHCGSDQHKARDCDQSAQACRCMPFPRHLMTDCKTQCRYCAVKHPKESNHSAVGCSRWCCFCLETKDDNHHALKCPPGKHADSCIVFDPKDHHLPQDCLELLCPSETCLPNPLGQCSIHCRDCGMPKEYDQAVGKEHTCQWKKVGNRCPDGLVVVRLQCKTDRNHTSSYEDLEGIRLKANHIKQSAYKKWQEAGQNGENPMELHSVECPECWKMLHPGAVYDLQITPSLEDYFAAETPKMENGKTREGKRPAPHSPSRAIAPRRGRHISSSRQELEVLLE
ncbi:putative CCHC-type domain-containing protein [Seiridium unicorne]|uniref:CCHC-type domain-containing protein n=1 Tax=Seiridium unicorne TaxID=138068 RepID=A0ABR2V998_9PEZI